MLPVKSWLMPITASADTQMAINKELDSSRLKACSTVRYITVRSIMKQSSSSAIVKVFIGVVLSEGCVVIGYGFRIRLRLGFWLVLLL